MLTGEADDRPAASAAAKPRPRRHLLAVAAVIVVAAAGGVRLGATHPELLPGGSDDVSQGEAQRRALLLAGLGTIKLAPVPPSQLTESIKPLGLDEGAAKAMLADAEASRVKMVWLSLYDSDAEDGDAVTIRSGGFTHSMVLTKRPIAVAVPVSPGTPVTLTGIVDGRGGGVTVGVVTQIGPVPLAPMSVGQTITLPVAAE